ncbi:MAG: hypothetical protein HQ465_15440 [Rhodospirillales bacterium]|nr:hypothetical protein [Rhodospirillales bacterium]
MRIEEPDEPIDFTPRFEDAAPRQRQLGGVDRSERPCVVEYQERDDRR